jgi:hypothetical protein
MKFSPRSSLFSDNGELFDKPVQEVRAGGPERLHYERLSGLPGRIAVWIAVFPVVEMPPGFKTCGGNSLSCRAPRRHSGTNARSDGNVSLKHQQHGARASGEGVLDSFGCEQGRQAFARIEHAGANGRLRYLENLRDLFH